jgi:hypothetical protein
LQSIFYRLYLILIVLERTRYDLAFVVVRLVSEAEDELDRQIEEEIRKETRMPWLAKVEKISVLDFETHHAVRR